MKTKKNIIFQCLTEELPKMIENTGGKSWRRKIKLNKKGSKAKRKEA